MKNYVLDEYPSKQAIAFFNEFKKKTGSEHIAKPTSITVLLNITKKTKPKRILELGAGIGTLTVAFLRNSGAHLDIYEDNDFCLKKLKHNIKGYSKRVTIIDNYRTLPPSQNYDLVVVDGGDITDGGRGYSESIWFFLRYIKKVKFVYVEGYRPNQRAMIRHGLRDRFLLTFERYSDVYIDGKKWYGGLLVKCKPSKNLFLKYASYFFWDIIVYLRKKYFLNMYKIKKKFVGTKIIR